MEKMHDNVETEGWITFEQLVEKLGLTEDELKAFWEAFKDADEERPQKRRRTRKNLSSLTVNSNKLYDSFPTSVAAELIKRISLALPAGREVAVSKNMKVKTEETRNGKYLLSYTGSNESYEISVDNVQAWKRKHSIQLRKAFNFILIKANQQNYPDKIYFQLDDYMKKTGITSKDAAFISAKRELETLLGFKVTGVRKRGKKEIRHAVEYVFTGRDISYNECYVKCMPGHVQMLCQYFTLLPQWAGELKTKAYDLIDYIYYLARQKNNQDNLSRFGHFNISLSAINSRIGGHDPNETRRHTEYIINPILDAIDEIEKTQKNGELKITPIYDHDYKNAHDFLEGYLRIEMEESALNYFLERDDERKKEIKKRSKKTPKTE